MAKHLVIVESPAKAKTIKRFLGKEYLVEASMGHVRDLPESGLGVDVEHHFAPTYEVAEGKENVVKKLKAALKEADDLWIATDEDREGEAIGWHLTQVLKEDPESVKRIVFHEITEEAIRAAIEHPRTLDMRLVDAQQARRILDRLVGYTLSPFLWKKVYSGLSAGRVQSVAVRILVDRERAIRAFTAEEYWSITAALVTGERRSFTAALEKKGGKKFAIQNGETATAVTTELNNALFTVTSVEEKEVERSPAPPFTTSTLQQEASRKLGFSVKQTMVVAQQLYEGIDIGDGGTTGLITYMRTDSVNLSDKALKDAAETIAKVYGREYILSTPRRYKTKSKGAQEAHEAIRPTEIMRTPQSLADVLDHQQLKLYTLIWNRTVATQMPVAIFKRIGADITAVPKGSLPTPPPYTFRATGQSVLFDGFLRVYSEGRDDPEALQEAIEDENEHLLPPLREGEMVTCEDLLPEQHFTKPPPRYTEASLVKKMEEEGIGRPSTYAPTISVIQQRGYVRKDGRYLIPEDIAFTVTDLLAEHFPQIVDLAFTATMEQSLDDIAEGEKKAATFLKNFFLPFQENVEKKTAEVKKGDVLKERVLGIDPTTGKEVIVKSGRFGPYVQLGRYEVEPRSGREKEKQGKGKQKKLKEKLPTASLPKGTSSETVTIEEALALLQFPRTLGTHDGFPVIVHLGRFGPYIKCGQSTVSLPKEVSPFAVTLDESLVIMRESAERKKRAAEPLSTLGIDPVSGGQVTAREGRYGPYVTDGTTNASIPKSEDVATITLERASELLAGRRGKPKRAWRGKRA